MTTTIATVIAESTTVPTMDIVWAAIAGLVVTILGVGATVVKAWGDQLVDKIKNDKVRDKVHIAKDEIGSVVFMISQTLVPAVRKAAADGRIDERERKQLRQVALEEAQARFSDEWWDNLMGELGIPKGRRAEWILGQVEAWVFRMKMQRDTGADPGAS